MHRRVWLPNVLTFGFAAAAIVLTLVWWSRLPEPMATHWGRSGAPDGHVPRWLFLLIPVFFVVGVALLYLLFGRRGGWFVGLGPALVSIWLGAAVIVLLRNLDAPTWQDADEVSGWIGIVVVVGVAVGVIVQWLCRPLARHAPHPRSARAPTAEFDETTGVRWPLVVLLPLVGLAVVGIAAGNWLVAVVGLTAGVLVANFTSVHVRIDTAGVRVTVGVLRFPRVTIPLDEIVSARIDDLKPLRWGGWGYRGSLKLTGNAAVVVRRGQALVLDLTGDRRFAVTIDYAERAVSVVDELVDTDGKSHH